MEKYISDILKIGIPSILGLFSTVLAYIFGRKKQIDEIKIKKNFEYAQRIASELQEVHDGYERLVRVWEENFAHMPFHKAIEVFEKHADMYDNEKYYIQQLVKKEEQLEKLYKESLIFLKTSFRKELKQYLELSKFVYHHDSLGLFNNYYEKFFENLNKKKEKRRLLFNELEKNFNKLI